MYRLTGFIEKQNKTFFFITLSILIPRKHNQMQKKNFCMICILTLVIKKSGDINIKVI